MIGSCPFVYWDVEIEWEREIIYYIRFKPRKTGASGPVPLSVRLFLAGKRTDICGCISDVLLNSGAYAHIYERVVSIPYGETASYGSIARDLETSPRLIGLAMKRNPTPLVIPCHRVVGKNGIGGFSPDIRIKEELLALEKRIRQIKRNDE